MGIQALLPLLFDFFDFFAGFFATVGRFVMWIQPFTLFGISLAFAYARTLSTY